jgi:beta-mannosidase
MKILNLNGKWNIQSEDNVYKMTGDVPGSLFYTLEQRGDFGKEGLFYKENNRKSLEIADRDFSYTREFTIGDDFLRNENLFLEAEGLDTLGHIFINGKKIAETDNMHRTWRFNISHEVIPGRNTIEILFKNSLEYIKNEKKRRDIYAGDGHGVTSVPGFNMIRKSHCSYGWDWGPKVPDLGIWRDIKIVSYDCARIKSVHVTQRHEMDRVFLQFNPQIEQFTDSTVSLNTTIESPEGQSDTLTINCNELTEYEVKDPLLWWPNGLGEQPLYQLKFALMENQSAIDQLSMRIGLRTLTIEQKNDQWGETFNFLCNGISIFARGGNYIPEDVFLNRKREYSTEQLIKDCKNANHNCLRVWGGGVYPSDELFDLCDENGLIVWQDLMFACAIYDVKNPHFLENISEELRDNLTRIRHHASIGLICGNNEMEEAFETWGFNPTKEERSEYLKQFQFIFPQIIREVCPELFYWPSSPSSGGDFESPNNPNKGDCHFWEVWHGNKDFSEYKNHFFRFMSEFGFESFPSMKTIKSFTSEEDLNIFSPVMEEHQKCIGGNGKILTYISKYFKYPRDLASLTYVSQLSQMEAITTGIRHWRRNRGRCMGSTYWQLNDNWPVASWSSIDYFGRWKALHYGAKRAYNNVLLSIDGDDKKASIHLSNESKDPVEGQLQWMLCRFNGEVLAKDSSKAEIQAFSSEKIEEKDFSQYLEGKNDREVYLSVTFTDKKGCIYREFHNFSPFKYLNLEDPGLTAKVTESSDHFSIEVSCEKPALFVEIDFSEADMVLPDNYFPMDGRETRVLNIEKKAFNLKTLQGQIMVRSLYNTY